MASKLCCLVWWPPGEKFTLRCIMWISSRDWCHHCCSLYWTALLEIQLLTVFPLCVSEWRIHCVLSLSKRILKTKILNSFTSPSIPLSLPFHFTLLHWTFAQVCRLTDLDSSKPFYSWYICDNLMYCCLTVVVKALVAQPWMSSNMDALCLEQAAQYLFVLYIPQYMMHVEQFTLFALRVLSVIIGSTG